MLADTKPRDKVLRLLKRFMYSQFALRDAFMILIGREQPRLSFSILADPPSVYINFNIRPDMAEEFARYINLGKALALAPIRCLEDEEPSLLLTLNIYEVSGIVKGLRAEWSTYITDHNGTARYMVLEARAQKGSMDAVNLFTRPDRVKHEVRGQSLRSKVASRDEALFSSTLPLSDTHKAVVPAAQWIAANDYIYWRNGVCDRTWYDASLFNAPVRIIPVGDTEIRDDTHWARFVDPQPRHVLKYDGEMNFVVAPWFNV